MKKIGIIGYGRFGKILYDLLSKRFEVLVYDFNEKCLENISAHALEEVLDCVLVFVAVPISAFEKCMHGHYKCVERGTERESAAARRALLIERRL